MHHQKWRQLHGLPITNHMAHSQLPIYRYLYNSHNNFCSSSCSLLGCDAMLTPPWRQLGHLKQWYPTTSLHSVTTQKTTTWNFSATKPSSLAWIEMLPQTVETSYLIHLYLAWSISLVKADSKIGQTDKFPQHYLCWWRVWNDKHLLTKREVLLITSTIK
jgi:hypothetical protein